MSALALFSDGRWLRVADGAVAGAGDRYESAVPGDDERVVAILPAHDVAIRSLDLGILAEVQAQAAARFAVAEGSVAAGVSLHSAAGFADAAGRRPVVAIEAARMTEHLLRLADAGFDPDHVLAAPMVLPRPDAGFVRGDLGSETVLRGADAAFGDDVVLTPLLTAGAEVVTLDRSLLEASLIAALADPEADLRSGPFAKRRRLSLAVDRLRWIATLALVSGLLVLASQFVFIIRAHGRAAALETEARTLAAAILPAGTVVTDPAAQVEARRAALQGAGGGFASLAAAVAAAIEADPQVELGALNYEADGSLRATVRATDEAQFDGVAARLQAAGLTTLYGPIVGGQARPYREVTVQQP